MKNRRKNNREKFKRLSKSVNEKLTELTEEQKSSLLNHFKDHKISNQSNFQPTQSFNIKNDIVNFFSKVVKKNKDLKKNFERHHETRFGKASKRRGIKIGEKKNKQDDSRVEFKQLVKSIRLNDDSSKFLKQSKSIAITKVLRDKFLYDDNRKTRNLMDKKSERKTFRESITSKFSKFLNGILFEKNFDEKDKKEIISDLNKYKTKLVEYINSSNKKIDSRMKNIEKYTKDLKNGVKVYTDNSLMSLLKFYRKLQINKLLKENTMIKIENRCKKIVSRRIKLIDDALRSTNDLPFYVREEFFCSVESFCIQDLPVLKMTRKVKKLDRVIPQMEKIYTIERKINAKTISKKEMKLKLGELLEYTVDAYTDDAIQNFEEVIFQDDTQDQFNKIIRDIRTTEGESIYNFLSAIRNHGGFKKIPAYEITEYIESFVLLIQRNHKFVKQSHMKILKQLADRLFYNLIGFDILSHEYSLLAPLAIENFSKKQSILSQMDPVTLGVDSKFLYKKNPNEPFAPAIEVLNNLEYCITPNDMIWAIYCCSKLIINEANEMCLKNNKKFTFGADELMPLIIYVISKSEVTYIQPNLSYVSKYGSEKSSEGIYYLTCFEGAVMYIANVSEDEITKLLDKTKKKKKIFQRNFQKGKKKFVKFIKKFKNKNKKKETDKKKKTEKKK